MGISDFVRFFYPAVQAWLGGQNPYSVEGAYNPFWAWWILTPFAAWPLPQAWWFWGPLGVGVLIVAVLLVRRPHPLALLGLALAPAALVHLALGQWTLWLLLGVALLQSRRPAVQGVGLFLLSLKPHLGWPFLLVTRPRAWPLPIGALLLSLLLQPRWPLAFLAGLQATPPIEYDQMLYGRSFGLGMPFLVALALGTVLLAVTMWRLLAPDRRWQIAILCCVVLIITPYQRLYDNVLLYYPILLLTEKRPWAWGPFIALLWLPALILGLWNGSVWVDWMLPLVILVSIAVALGRNSRILVNRRLQPGVQQ